MFIVILELCWMVKADEYHVVASGPCVDEGDAYCIKRVPNSFCSVTKNECFCQPAYVAIQEEYGITCKPRKSIVFIFFYKLCKRTSFYKDQIKVQLGQLGRNLLNFIILDYSRVRIP